MNSGKTIFVKVILAVVLLIPINAYADWTAKPSMLLDEWVNRPLEEFYDVWEMTPFPFLNIPGFGPPSGNISVLNSACKIRLSSKRVVLSAGTLTIGRSPATRS